ncbi:DNA ligase D [Undibacterium terreum]|uniref:DNA ligase (ATP) n=1 Tax=Undibacterium terreum TaxID=1224302 RepID=A0A916UFY3_9BURK|nr:DNA ligase D [Undibacterium terreum]GGC69558.1 ATP-dependent DNA ligase [Undibacterium terreum]
MSLEKYWEKRDFSATPEPRGKPGPRPTALRSPLRYFIQRHHARALHYDFRLELEGTLKSWAIPKGPSLNPAEKRLAVHVEDHPLSYGSFEGIIPARQYGAGEVVLWDAGYWLPIGDPEHGYRKGRLKFELQGEKLSGTWALVRMGAAKQEKENWLLIKEDDDSARTGNDANITTLRPESVLDKLQSRKQAARQQSAREDSRTLDGIPDLDGAVKKKMPASVMPQLATLVDTAPDSEGWVSEIKFDGYRALSRIDGKKIQLLSRSGKDWTSKWQAVADALAQLKCRQAWLDGEMVAIDADSNISFQALQNMTDGEDGQEGFHLAYYLFDVIYLDGYDLSEMALIDRKLLLKQLIGNYQGDRLLYSEHMDAKVADVAKQACRHQMEGIIIKSADAGYRQSRSRNWLKLKCKNRQEFVLGGYTDPAGSREAFGAVLVGTYNDKRELVYAGRVGTGFDGGTLKELMKKFSAIEQADSAFLSPPSGVAAHGVHWLKPVLVAEIEFAQWTESGTLRHASFIALRDDKKPGDIHRENPAKLGQVEEEDPSKEGGEQEVAGVRLTHPDRVVFAGTGLSKHDLALYYETVQEWILPHLKKRPLTIVRCPQGGENKCFFQKHAAETIPDGIGRIAVPESEGTAVYMMANTLEALVALVQIGALELHTWGSHQRALMKPDRITFDLDPAPGLQWQRTVEAAQLMRGLLTEVGLQSFVKTTGGKGLHVVVPIVPGYGWDELKAWSHSIADYIADILPAQFTSNSRKSSRDGKIFLDYLRNGQGATAVAAYSPRNREHAPVSTPLFWEELDEGVRSDTFTIKNLPGRLQQLQQDPWQDYFTLKQKISSKMLRLFQRGETA